MHNKSRDNFHKVNNIAYKFTSVNNPLKNFELAKVTLALNVLVVKLFESLGLVKSRIELVDFSLV